MATRPTCFVGNPAWLVGHGVKTNLYSLTVSLSYHSETTCSGCHGVPFGAVANDFIRVNYQDDHFIDQANLDISPTIGAGFL